MSPGAVTIETNGSPGHESVIRQGSVTSTVKRPMLP